MQKSDKEPVGNNRVVGNDFIRVACEEDHTFVYIPARLNRLYLEQVLSDSLRRKVAIRSCQTTNLCASVWGGVSYSGATVLRLSMALDDGDHLDVVAKVLCPDSVNLFKLDRRFSGRVAEIAWAKWWGEQGVPWVPRVYATRLDRTAREFWILQEYFPQVGWADAVLENAKLFNNNRGRLLLNHAADLHAHSRERIDELLRLFPDDWPCVPSLVTNVTEAVTDASFLASIGVSDHERTMIEHCCHAVERRPEWVDEWELVCVTADIAPDNVGVRRSGTVEELVTFDWSATGLAPMEAEIDVMLGRLRGDSQEEKEDLTR